MRFSFRPLLFAAVVIASSIFTNCRQDADPEPLPGTISGLVTAQDELGRPESAAGVTVSLEGGSAALTATTDAEGAFEFKNLPFGTYNTIFKRADLGTSREEAIVLDAQYPTEKCFRVMGKPATTSITSFTLTGSVALPNSIPYTLQVDYNPVIYPDGFMYMIYVSNNASVSNTDFLRQYYGSAASGTKQTQLWFTIDQFKVWGFAKGSTVYLVAYGAPAVHTAYSGIASSNGNRIGITSNLNPVHSSVVSFVMP